MRSMMRGVVVRADASQIRLGEDWITYGRNDEYAALVETTIMSTGSKGVVESYDVDQQNKITITAPQPAEGYRFAGWKAVLPDGSGEMISADTDLVQIDSERNTITFTWKAMGTMYEAVYQPIS